jgi:hypothetical protein
MKPTASSTLLVAATMGGVALWATEYVLLSVGRPVLVPPLTWGVAFGLLGIIILVAAWPIRAHALAPEPATRVDPFYATRVVLLAQASALTGAGFTGGGVGVLVFFLTRPVLSSAALWLSVLALLGAILLMVGGLVAQKWCTLPPDSTDVEGSALPEGEPGR